MKYLLSQIIVEYSEKNTENKYEPVAVGKYGIRKRTDIYKKELSDDYSKNKLIYNNTLTIGMGSKQIDFGVLTENEIYSVSPAYKTFKINTDIVDARFFELYLKAFNEFFTSKYMIASARQGKKVDVKNMLKEYVDIPDFSTQVEFVNKMSVLSKAISNDMELIGKYDELVNTAFLELFGDPIRNDKGWKTVPLLEMGACKNGMNFSYSDSGVDINCLGVGDFKDYSVIDGTDELPFISLNSMPSQDNLLQDGDIVFVRSNGNKALVGRSLVVFPGNNPTAYSGFCIRYRLAADYMNVFYLLRVLKLPSVREKMFGRGSNIQNLNALRA